MLAAQRRFHGVVNIGGGHGKVLRYLAHQCSVFSMVGSFG